MAAAADDGTDWAIIRRRSVIVSGKKEGKPFVREDFTDSLVSILENVKENLASFGPLARNSEWFLSLKTDVAKDNMLSAGSMKVRGTIFYISSADTSQFPARVHWAPPFIPNAAIAQVLQDTCTVQSMKMETSTAKGFEGIPTGIRRLILAGNKDDIPHTFIIVNPKTGERFELLDVIAGRSPVFPLQKKPGIFAVSVSCLTAESVEFMATLSKPVSAQTRTRVRFVVETTNNRVARPRHRLTTTHNMYIETVESSRSRVAPGREACLGTLRRALAAALGLGQR